MNEERKAQLRKWMADMEGNVSQIGENLFIEQTTQWKQKFSFIGLIRFAIREFEI